MLLVETGKWSVNKWRLSIREWSDFSRKNKQTNRLEGVSKNRPQEISKVRVGWAYRISQSVQERIIKQV